VNSSVCDKEMGPGIAVPFSTFGAASELYLSS
jgi:hypothetical protein